MALNIVVFSTLLISIALLYVNQYSESAASPHEHKATELSITKGYKSHEPSVGEYTIFAARVHINRMLTFQANNTTYIPVHLYTAC